ncbi:hypothetical protein MTR_3g037510 [Medicago truncatula]|uniref:Uncharacterized protein n=2 Tax=Medicago truncatula TaxID=3880 RepID=A0A072UVN1_MEDTR|nr:hypothetical protein MTR_3g037510 [Medicago truncatula]
MCKEYHYADFCFDQIFSLLKSAMDEETEVAATECAVGVGATKGAVGVGSTEGVIEAKANPESTQQAAAELPPFPTTRCKRPNANGMTFLDILESNMTQY